MKAEADVLRYEDYAKLRSDYIKSHGLYKPRPLPCWWDWVAWIFYKLGG